MRALLIGFIGFCLGGALVFFWASYESQKGYDALEAMNQSNLAASQACRAQLTQDDSDLAQYRAFYHQVQLQRQQAQASGSAALGAIARELLRP